MDLAVAEELGVLEAGNQAHDALLFAESQVILKAHQVVAVGAQILLAKLDGGVGTAAGARVGQPHRLHGTEAQGVAAAAGDLFDGQAGFEVRRVVRDMRFHALRRQQFVDEALVLGLCRTGSSDNRRCHRAICRSGKRRKAMVRSIVWASTMGLMLS